MIACSPVSQSEISHLLKISKIQYKHVESGKFSTSSTQIHDSSLSNLGTSQTVVELDNRRSLKLNEYKL